MQEKCTMSGLTSEGMECQYSKKKWRDFTNTVDERR